MKVRLMVMAAASAAALASSASAAPVNWTGWYIGAHGGGDFGESKWSDLIVPEDSGQDIAGPLVSTSPSGGFGGAQGGYNLQAGGLVFGVEGDVTGLSSGGQKPCIGNYADYAALCRSSMSFSGSVTGRAGIAWNQALFYAKAGVAVARSSYLPAEEATIVGFDRIPPGYQTTSDTRWGPTVGVGLEYALNSHWSVAAEYDYQDFGTKRVTFVPRTGVAGAEADLSPVFSADVSQRTNLIEAKVNYRF